MYDAIEILHYERQLGCMVAILFDPTGEAKNRMAGGSQITSQMWGNALARRPAKASSETKVVGAIIEPNELMSVQDLKQNFYSVVQCPG